MGAAGRPDAAVEHAAGNARPPARAKLKYARLPFLVLSIFALLAALLGGLLRLGWSLPELQPGLLAGYFWLGVGGLAWLWFTDDLTTFHCDVMLHSVFLGFVFSMIFLHAPLIFPAVLQRPLPYRRFLVHSVEALFAAFRLAGN